MRSFSAALGLDTKRIQFTPDLMPGDVSGSLVYDAKTGEFEFREGPVFTNIVLADEINRTPPKTQAALLEAMEERQVSTDGVTRPLPDPFLVAATQNPIEHEGTYTLPEAQLDRFLLKLIVDVPARDAELAVLRRHASGFDPRDLAGGGPRPASSAPTRSARRSGPRHPSPSPTTCSATSSISRRPRAAAPRCSSASARARRPRCSRRAKAWAWLGGYPAITPDHVQTMLVPTWRHRIRLRARRRARGRVGRRRARLGAAADPRADLEPSLTIERGDASSGGA